MKLSMLTLVAALGALAAVADPVVSNVQVSQAADRTVTVTYGLSGAPAIVTFDVLTNGVSIGGTNLWSTFGDVYKRIDADGTYKIHWSPDGLGEAFDLHAATLSFQVTARPVSDPPLYMVCGLTTNTPTYKGEIRYYPGEAYLPGGLLGNVEYRTTRLVCRRIYAKGVTWNMGDPAGSDAKAPKHEVTLPKDYYIGVFELTQAQAFNIAGARDSVFSYEGDWAMRPMEWIKIATFRGASYPTAPTTGSRLGKLRKITGLDFEVPSEAQWEFACRAGHYKAREWNNGAFCAAADEWKYDRCNLPGRFTYNSGFGTSEADKPDAPADLGATNGTAIVGSYAPSSWGLYDMHCNVAECCLDYYRDDPLASNPDASTGVPNCNGSKCADGTTSPDNGHVVRGSHFCGYPTVAYSHCRSKDYDGGKRWVGYRLIVTID